jgi:hypothetical protein
MLTKLLPPLDLVFGLEIPPRGADAYPRITAIELGVLDHPMRNGAERPRFPLHIHPV